MPVRKEQLARTAVAPRAVPAAEQPEVLLLRKLRLAGRRFPHLPCSGPGLRVSAAASPSPGPRSGHRRPRRVRRGCGAPSGRRGRARRGPAAGPRWAEATLAARPWPPRPGPVYTRCAPPCGAWVQPAGSGRARFLVFSSFRCSWLILIKKISPSVFRVHLN